MIQLTMQKITEHIYRFNENGPDMNVDAFLVIGSKKAIMIDGLMQAEGLYSMVRNCTNLPLEMIVLHGHLDHAGNGTKEFMDAGCKIYMSPLDYPLLKEFSLFYPKDAFCWLTGTEHFSLGGITLQTIPVPGHTKGSLSLYSPELDALFCSDCIGSGDVWLWLPHSLPLHEYHNSLVNLLDFLNQHPSTHIYTGHLWQLPAKETVSVPYTDIAYVKELLKLTDDIISGQKRGYKIDTPFAGFHVNEVRVVSGDLIFAYTYSPDQI